MPALCLAPHYTLVYGGEQVKMYCAPGMAEENDMKQKDVNKHYFKLWYVLCRLLSWDPRHGKEVVFSVRRRHIQMMGLLTTVTAIAAVITTAIIIINTEFYCAFSV